MPATATADPATSPGLTSEEARRRLQKFGANGVAEVAARPVFAALGKFWAPVPWMLEAAIVLQLVLGEYVEAAFIGALLFFNAALGFFQENRAQATLNALKSRLALNATVRRDGSWKNILAAQLVPGDIIKLSLGGVVGADVRLLNGELLLDQSTLTGESLPVEASAGTTTYAGALVRRGEATAEVTATGARTKFGRTAELVRTAHAVSSQQKAVLGVVRNLVLFNAAIVVAQVAYAVSLKLPILEIIPLALTAILAAVPVALPATFTLASALGARALAKRNVLPTRLSAVDEAATMDILCADKTGTLTQNELAVTAGASHARLRRTACTRPGGPGQLRRRSGPGGRRHPVRLRAQQADGCAQTRQISALRSGEQDVGGHGYRFCGKDSSSRERRLSHHRRPGSRRAECDRRRGRIGRAGLQGPGSRGGTPGGSANCRARGAQ